MHFSDPKANVLQIGLKEGMKVGDLGTGAGLAALTAAHLVGGTGHVYAVDIQEDLLKRVRDAAHEQGLRNLSTIWGDFEKLGGTTLKDHALDAVILSNTLFQLEHREGALAEIKRILKPGGRLLIVDWAGAYGGLGPHPDHVVPEHAAEELFIGGGFHKTKAFRAGPHHYSILFTAP
ncbi:MAG TPA: methyltransferase domain-containing protein [Candidatus Paceibacterota bacterium]|nr:methyltransferase domain-containing protein [Candidatus Paceibacterota bacterium]